MKLVNLKTFLALPDGIVAAKWEPTCFDPIFIKTRSVPETDTAIGDFFAYGLEATKDTCNDVVSKGEAVLKFDDLPTRDGDLDPDQLFAVWSSQDITAVVEKLKATLPAAATATEMLSIAGMSRCGKVVRWIKR